MIFCNRVGRDVMEFKYLVCVFLRRDFDLIEISRVEVNIEEVDLRRILTILVFLEALNKELN